MRLEELPTPAAVVDLDRVERNCAAMSERIRALGCRLRPHVKTHKTLEAARLQTSGHFGGITVSTLAEARYFMAGGFRDITYAVPLSPFRAQEAADLGERLDRFTLVADSPEALDALEAAVERSATRRPVSVLLKVDCGYHRAGVDPRDEASIELARRMATSAAIDFRGVLAHGGHAYHRAGREALRDAADEERDTTWLFAERLRAAGMDVPEVSIGSTPTMAIAEDLAGITEVRPGNYAFFDDTQLALGACGPDERAFSVLATVIGAYPARGTVVIDAGALALSKDAGAPELPGWRGGYGSFEHPASGARLHGLALVSLSQEHGVVEAATAPGRAGLAGLRPGSRLRVFPNHSCLTAALHAVYHVARGDEVVETWTPCRGW